MDRRVGRRRGRQVPCEHAISAASGASVVRRTQKGRACCRHPCRSRDRQLVVTCRTSCRTRRARLRSRRMVCIGGGSRAQALGKGQRSRREGERACVRAGPRTSVVGVSTPPEPACGVVPHSAPWIFDIAPPPLEAWGAVKACAARTVSINRNLFLELLGQVGIRGCDHSPQGATRWPT